MEFQFKIVGVVVSKWVLVQGFSFSKIYKEVKDRPRERVRERGGGDRLDGDSSRLT